MAGNDSVPPKRMALAEVPAYLATRGYRASRKSVFNWSKTPGKAGVVLETYGFSGGRYTTTRAVDRFIDAVLRADGRRR